MPSTHPIFHPVLRIAVATGLLVMSFSLYAPVLAVMLQQRGHGPVVVGAFAMIGFSTIAVLIPFMPKILAYFGELRAYRIGMALFLLSTLVYATVDYLPIWCVIAALGACGSAAVWNATEALIARYAPPARRGRIMGLYQTLLGAAMAFGPFVPSLLQVSGGQALMVAASVQGLGLLLVLKLPALPPVPQTVSSVHPHAGVSVALPVGTWTGALTMTTWQALQAVPALALLAFAGGVFESGLSSVSAAYGAASGLSLASAASIVGALGAGSFLFQFPAGLLADWAKPSRVFGAAGALLLVSSLALFVTPAGALGIPWWLWACAFIWGGVGGALYTLTMVRVAHQFKGPDTAAGTAAMITGYTLGGAVGPPVSGLALQALGLPGLGLWLGVLSIVVLLLSKKT